MVPNSSRLSQLVFVPCFLFLSPLARWEARGEWEKTPDDYVRIPKYILSEPDLLPD